MKKVLIALFFIFAALAIAAGILGYNYYKEYQIIGIKDVLFNEYDGENIAINIIKEEDRFHNEFKCIITNTNTLEKLEIDGKDNKCDANINTYDTYEIIIKDKEVESTKKLISNATLLKNSIEFTKDEVIIAIDEKVSIPCESESVFYSKDDSIVKIEDGKIVGVSVGTTYIYTSNAIETLKVTVTDLFQKAILEENKELLGCNIYSKEDNDLLDKVLEERINDVGYKTRAAAVEAARFLTLNIKYMIPYFYENGRVSDTGVNFTDGEGRYYKKGLYLNESRFENIIATFAGPATWGCPLRNFESEPRWGYYAGTLKPNGLDCSGFVSWTLNQAGFDPGDHGAGEDPGNDQQMTDLGNWVPLTYDLIYSDTIKVGDMFNYWGHISIIIGIKDGRYYVAESLPQFKGVAVKTYTRENVTETFNYIVLMDDYYKEDGKLTDYWE